MIIVCPDNIHISKGEANEDVFLGDRVLERRKIRDPFRSHGNDSGGDITARITTNHPIPNYATTFTDALANSVGSCPNYAPNLANRRHDHHYDRRYRE